MVVDISNDWESITQDRIDEFDYKQPLENQTKASFSNHWRKHTLTWALEDGSVSNGNLSSTVMHFHSNHRRTTVKHFFTVPCRFASHIVRSSTRRWTSPRRSTCHRPYELTELVSTRRAQAEQTFGDPNMNYAGSGMTSRFTWRLAVSGLALRQSIRINRINKNTSPFLIRRSIGPPRLCTRTTSEILYAHRLIDCVDAF